MYKEKENFHIVYRFVFVCVSRVCVWGVGGVSVFVKTLGTHPNKFRQRSAVWLSGSENPASRQVSLASCQDACIFNYVG